MEVVGGSIPLAPTIHALRADLRGSSEPLHVLSAMSCHSARWQPTYVRSAGHGRRGRGQHWPGPAQGGARRRASTASWSTPRIVIGTDAKLAIVTEKDPDGLEVIRHSTAHLLAQAVKELFPEAQVTIGPVIEDGFYYDFAFKRPFTPEDLAAIEAKMHGAREGGPEGRPPRDAAR